MNKDNTTKTPTQPEQPSPKGLDGAACSPIWFILRWHWLVLLWRMITLGGFIWLVVGVIQGRDGYDIAMAAAVIGMTVVRVENYLDARRREVSEEFDLANQSLKASPSDGYRLLEDGEKTAIADGTFSNSGNSREVELSESDT